MMKAKLSKAGNQYLLRDFSGEVLASTNSSREGKKISKQNCDDIFCGLYATEIEVEIEMICPHPKDSYRCGMWYGCDTECYHPNKIPYLDSEGCLILKKI